MQKNRVQCSLIFPDDEVFENLVLPLKSQRELSNFLVSLVTKYYKNPTIQNAVNEQTVEQSNSRKELYQEINQSLAVMDFLVSEGRNIVADGADVFDEIVAGAEETGVFVKETDEFGTEVNKVNPDLLNNIARIESKSEPQSVPVEQPVVPKVEEQIPVAQQPTETYNKADIEAEISARVAEQISAMKTDLLAELAQMMAGNQQVATPPKQSESVTETAVQSAVQSAMPKAIQSVGASVPSVDIPPMSSSLGEEPEIDLFEDDED